MSKNKSIWDTQENADIYNEYVENYPMYKDTANDLLGLINIKMGDKILDLASGTGIVISKILEKNEKYLEIIGLDQSEKMLDKAKSKFKNFKNINFIVSEIENFANYKKYFDSVLCNSAFWQMNTEIALKNISNSMKTGGVFAFNLPDQVFIHPDFILNKKPKKIIFTREDLINTAKTKNLKLIKEKVIKYKKHKDEQIAFLNIPVIKNNFKSEEERKDRVLDIKAPTESEWAYFVFQKI